MALTKPLTITIYGKELIFENAYSKITFISGNEDNLTLTLTTFDNSNKQNVLKQQNYIFTPNIDDAAPNFMKQGYEYLKTLDEFKEAISI